VPRCLSKQAVVGICAAAVSMVGFVTLEQDSSACD